MAVRQIESIIKDFNFIAWTCSECGWGKNADEPGHITGNTLAQFHQHRCEDFPLAVGKR
jgi:hypothetical protein